MLTLLRQRSEELDNPVLAALATKVEKVASLNTAFSENEAKRDGLSEQTAELTKELDELNTPLSTTTKLRNDVSAENAATVSEDQKVLETMNDLEKHQKMIDDAVKVLEDPKPARVDTAMSNADRARDRVRQRWPSFLIKMAELSHQDLSPVSNGLRPA